MIKNLCLPHGVDAWINRMMVKTIEHAIVRAMGWPEDAIVSYAYDSCPLINKGREVCIHRLKWHGKGLIRFIRKLHRLEGNAPVLYATHFKNKGPLQREFDREEADPYYDSMDYYWLGDVARNARMVCGDQMFVELWNRLRR